MTLHSYKIKKKIDNIIVFRKNNRLLYKLKYDILKVMLEVNIIVLCII